MTDSPILQRLDTLAEHSDVYKDSQRLAVIDLGSNSFRLIVVEYVPRLSFRVVDEVQESVRLSEGMAEANIMRVSAMDRAARAVQIYAAFCRASGISDITAVGTSAIRDAKNQERFLARLHTETGISVRVLSGEEEAYYGYLAAVNSTTLENGFVIDLGGGSFEITRVENRRVTHSTSLPLGAVRVTEGFLPSDPAPHKELERLRDHLARQFEAIKWFRREPGMRLVGEGGSLRLAARLAQRADEYPLDMLHGYQLAEGALKDVRGELAHLTIAQRKRLPGMKPERADIALGGAAVVAEAMRASGFDDLTICNQGMREGIFYERFLQGDGLPLFEHVRQAAVLNLGHLYRYQEKHAEHITHLTLAMFDQLPPGCHQCGPAERELLWAASMLHDIGVAIDYNGHHQHGAYLILNGGLPGYTHREIALIALMIRYHRRGNPKPDELALLLDPGDDRRLVQLCALLRLAEQLDRSRDGVVQDVVLTGGGDWAQMELLVRGDGQVALWALEHHRDIFEQAFGLKLEVALAPSRS
jgi:exopolyphosphatase/guanosine-5'-triphosphate,3'-diphosphate pyrophosphatase